MLEKDVVEISVVSTLDGAEEKSLLYYPADCENVPLLVGLHSWSFGRFNQQKNMLPLCRERQWALLLPEFRGPNLAANPRALETCGSVLARQDIVDAVDFVLGGYSLAPRKIMLLGGSGGGHMALMMAAYRPQLWAAVSAWCPITDLAAWHRQERYVQHLEACCGGKPGDSAAVNQIYFDKSPVNYAADIARANIFVHHGRFDSSVPYSHTMELIAKVEACSPESFFFEIFTGKHELRLAPAIAWLETQIAGKETGAQITG